MNAPLPKEELLPCPFCGAGQTNVEPASQHWTGMRYDVLAWHVVHWCENRTQAFGNRIEHRAKLREEAVASWNRRAT